MNKSKRRRRTNIARSILEQKNADKKSLTIRKTKQFGQVNQIRGYYHPTILIIKRESKKQKQIM